MKLNEISFVNLTKDSVELFLKKAKKRIIFAKPAFYEDEIELILKLKNEKNLHCELYFEAADQAIRLGFGDPAALKSILSEKDGISLQLVNRIKLAILIVDEEILIYSPKIVFMDDDEIKNELPSGLIGGRELTRTILEFFPPYQIELEISEEKSVDIFDIPKIIEKQKETVIQEIKDAIKKLDNTPPTNPKDLKQTFFYRNKYKIVKYEMLGIQIKNKKLNLNSFIKLLPEQNERLKSSWNIFSKEDLDQLQDMGRLRSEVDSIVDKYLIDIGRFGYIVPVESKKNFEAEIKKATTDFKAYIKGEVGKGNLFAAESKNGSRPNITGALLNSREELLDYLQTISNNHVDNIIGKNRYLAQKVQNRELTKTDALKEYISQFIDNKLKFPLEEEIINRIDIRMDYYDVSNELLYENKDFKEIMTVKGIIEEDLRENKEGREVMKL